MEIRQLAVFLLLTGFGSCVWEAPRQSGRRSSRRIVDLQADSSSEQNQTPQAATAQGGMSPSAGSSSNLSSTESLYANPHDQSAESALREPGGGRTRGSQHQQVARERPTDTVMRDKSPEVLRPRMPLETPMPDVNQAGQNNALRRVRSSASLDQAARTSRSRERPRSASSGMKRSPAVSSDLSKKGVPEPEKPKRSKEPEDPWRPKEPKHAVFSEPPFVIDRWKGNVMRQIEEARQRERYFSQNPGMRRQWDDFHRAHEAWHGVDGRYMAHKKELTERRNARENPEGAAEQKRLEYGRLPKRPPSSSLERLEPRRSLDSAMPPPHQTAHLVAASRRASVDNGSLPSASSRAAEARARLDAASYLPSSARAMDIQSRAKVARKSANNEAAKRWMDEVDRARKGGSWAPDPRASRSSAPSSSRTQPPDAAQTGSQANAASSARAAASRSRTTSTDGDVRMSRSPTPEPRVKSQPKPKPDPGPK